MTCGTQVPENVPICPDCGTELKAAPPPQPQPPPTPPPSVSAEAGQQKPSHPPGGQAVPSPSTSTVQGKITLRRGGVLTSESFVFGARVVVGRFDVESGPVDVDLSPLPESSYLSRRHAEIWSDDSGKWFVKDLGSQNGTFVRLKGSDQFQRVTQEQAVGDGDEIAFGNARFEFRSS
jgi:pSer/pThr/pTyr-binding forkhead associated (FHA) protein